MKSKNFTLPQSGAQVESVANKLVAEIYSKLKDASVCATVCSAESCTGGMISQWFTNPAGSSQFFIGGVCAYSNQVKSRVLGVDASVIATNGAVSSPVVEAMAAGAVQLLGADWAVSVSGIAGPGGGTPDKPVGTIWCGVAGPAGNYSRLLRLSGDRKTIREAASIAALQFLLEKIDEA